ncbi:MAG: hypothetical protein K9H23_22420 [Saprospiraceae bacterium]|nr:hypothetical protein [Saprospiraceae bacterium]
MSFLLLPLLLTVAPIQAQHAEKTLVKSFNLNGQNAVFLDLDGDVKVITWNEPQMRIQMTITLQNGSETMLKSLVTSGRYNLNPSEENGAYSIIAPGLDRQIKLGNGQLLGEQISYEVYAPKEVTISTRNIEAIGMAETDGSSF